MYIEVEANPNCAESQQFVFQELGPPRGIKGIKILERGKEVYCDVVGVEADGRFADAFSTKIADSGAGFAYIIRGGAWGIRIRPGAFSDEAWDLLNKRQWGEPFKIYGDEEDIVYQE